MNLCQPCHEAVFKQTMMLKAKQAKLKWCILGVVAQSKAGINLASGQRLWISCYTAFSGCLGAESGNPPSFRKRLTNLLKVAHICIIFSHVKRLERTQMVVALCWDHQHEMDTYASRVRGGHQAKLDVKAGKIYVVLYFPAYCYRSSDKNYVKWHLQYQNLFAVKSAVIHRFSLAFHSRSITRSCCPLPLLSCYCSLYTKDCTWHHFEIILDCIIVSYSNPYCSFSPSQVSFQSTQASRNKLLRQVEWQTGRNHRHPSYHFLK